MVVPVGLYIIFLFAGFSTPSEHIKSPINCKVSPLGVLFLAYGNVAQTSSGIVPVFPSSGTIFF
jgi:hypothetical protein